MNLVTQIEYLEIEEKKEYNQLIQTVIEQCFKQEGLERSNLYISITLTNPKNIKEINTKYRKIDKETDVLSFPMFEKGEIKKENAIQDVLGDIVISIQKVEEQAKEYGHTFTRELAYMLVHGFYHLMGYDHLKEDEKQQMREKEEIILNNLNIKRI